MEHLVYMKAFVSMLWFGTLHPVGSRFAYANLKFDLVAGRLSCLVSAFEGEMVLGI